jgi:hypothetical protein
MFANNLRGTRQQQATKPLTDERLAERKKSFKWRPANADMLQTPVFTSD